MGRPLPDVSLERMRKARWVSRLTSSAGHHWLKRGFRDSYDTRHSTPRNSEAIRTEFDRPNRLEYRTSRIRDAALSVFPLTIGRLDQGKTHVRGDDKRSARWIVPARTWSQSGLGG